MTLFTRAFWNAAGERAVKTVAQALVAFLGVSGSGLLALNWTVALSTALGAGLVSVLTSLVSATPVAPAITEPEAAPVAETVEAAPAVEDTEPAPVEETAPKAPESVQPPYESAPVTSPTA